MVRGDTTTSSIRQAVAVGLTTPDETNLEENSSFLVTGVRVDTRPGAWTVQVLGRQQTWVWGGVVELENGYYLGDHHCFRECPPEVVTIEFGDDFQPDNSDWYDSIQEEIKRQCFVDRLDLAVGWRLWQDGQEIFPGEE